MFQVENKSNQYYILNVENEPMFLFNHPFTLNELIEYVAIHNTHIYAKYNNRILDNVNMNFNDKTGELYIPEYPWDVPGWKYTVGLRKYMIIDGYYRIIDIRDFIKEIMSIDSSYYYYNKRNRRKIEDRYYHKFRQGPVPYTGNRKYYAPIRQINTTNEKRQNSDKDIEQYIRGKRKAKNIPSSDDAEYRRYKTKSWKDQSKKERQWMK